MFKFLLKKKKKNHQQKNNNKGQKPKNRMYMITEDIVDQKIDKTQPVSILNDLKEK